VLNKVASHWWENERMERSDGPPVGVSEEAEWPEDCPLGERRLSAFLVHPELQPGATWHLHLGA
jgi:hypothetical protein